VPDSGGRANFRVAHGPAGVVGSLNLASVAFASIRCVFVACQLWLYVRDCFLCYLLNNAFSLKKPMSYFFCNSYIDHTRPREVVTVGSQL
jgi:hypothetical protein